jgi:hypothetical protein
MLALFAGHDVAGARERYDGDDPDFFDMLRVEDELIVANTLVAIGAAGTLPTSLATRDFQLQALHATTLFGSTDEVVLYHVTPQPGSSLDYGLVIDFLETAVSGACVDLNLVHGSPNIFGSGSQYGIEDAQMQAEQAFYGHWSWQQIHAPHTVGIGGTPYQGQNVVVALLDVFQEYGGGDQGTGFNSADLWDDAAITFHIPADLPPISMQAGVPSMAYHGDTILSLARVLAPASDYMAVRTLNQQGFGYTYSVVQALDYVLTTVAAQGAPDLVVNMSFGAERADRCGIMAQLLDAGRQQLNVVYVAASGNQYEGDGPRPEALFPARYGEVIAAAASNRVKQLASYSNLGDLMAPGGDEPFPGANHCEDEAEGILGRIPTPAGMQNVVSCGTSFSAGFVSGLAAATFSTPIQEAPLVVKAIQQGAQQNGQIIDVASTLQP